jgi:hypothetical protein
MSQPNSCDDSYFVPLGWGWTRGDTEKGRPMLFDVTSSERLLSGHRCNTPETFRRRAQTDQGRALSFPGRIGWAAAHIWSRPGGSEWPPRVNGDHREGGGPLRRAVP